MLELAGIAFLFLGLLASIALHELGHFATARRFGCKVTEFMVGFGPTLWSTKRGETEYGVKAVPLGGYVRILGMLPPVGEGGGAIASEARARSLEEMPLDSPRAFWRIAPWKKVIVMAAGPFMNLLIWLLLTIALLAFIGIPGVSSRVGAVVPCVPASVSSTGYECPAEPTPSPASVAGVMPGDSFVSINGLPVGDWESAVAAMRALPVGEATPIVVLRSGEEVSLEVVPVTSPLVGGASYVGVSPELALVPVPFGEVPGIMGGQLAEAGIGIATFPVKLFSTIGGSLAGEARDPEGPVGLVGIGRIGGEVAGMEEFPGSFRLVQLLSLLAGLNLALFAFNMIPLLPLDGGHVAAALWEALRRRFARLRGRPDPGPVDLARLLPLTYGVMVVFIAATLMLVMVDLLNPIKMFGN